MEPWIEKAIEKSEKPYDLHINAGGELSFDPSEKGPMFLDKAHLPR